jgi:hypothetical protein
MAHGPDKPPRRWILGVLLLAVSLLTGLSLTSQGSESATGPFGQLWVLLWMRAFGTPGLCLILLVGCLWGVGLLARWPRGFLWGLAGLIGPTVVTWDAFGLALNALPGRGPEHGRLAYLLYDAMASFFGPDAHVQHVLALATLSATCTILIARLGLPGPIRAFLAEGLAGAAQTVGRGFVLLAQELARVARWLGRALGFVGQRWLGPAAAGAGHGLAGAWRARSTAPPSGEGAPSDAGSRRMGASSWEDGPSGRPAAAAPRDASAPRSGSLPGGDARRHTQPGGAMSPAEALASPTLEASRRARAVRPGAVKSGTQAVATIDLLEDHDARVAGVSQHEIRENAELLKRTLASFDIEGEVSEVHPGPIITRYEFTPGVGVTISQIVSRQDDLALAMRAPRVRLLAPIPGKAAVGVEIPNREPALISFKDVVTEGRFLEARDPLAVALGKDVMGRPFFTSLEKMPHLLVAGTTGSGKSVCMNTLIVSLLLRCTPERLRLLMIDPKMLEFTAYNDIPHLLRPVVTQDREAARALRWLTKEMEQRYRTMAGLGVRNIQGYEQKRAADTGPERLPAMPYIVVLVDELADLMLSNASEIELPVARLAQMARAVGIHLVLATQRPSVDVITGVIKANFPARIAFQVATRTDSRTVLDMNGAESLLGRGDMLFIPPGKAQAHRIHGAFLSDAEIERVAAYLRQFPAPEMLGPLELEEGPSADGEDGDDPLFGEALRIVVLGQQGSTSMLQRRLRIGYTRAGRLMDMLEQSGIVGPPDGSRARDVLVPPDYLEKEHPELERVLTKN